MQGKQSPHYFEYLINNIIGRKISDPVLINMDCNVNAVGSWTKVIIVKNFRYYSWVLWALW